MPEDVKATVAKSTMIAAFSRWEAEYREDPAQFMTRMEQDELELETYGERATATFLRYIEEVSEPVSGG